MRALALFVLALTLAANAAAAEGKAHEPQPIEGYALARSYAPGQTARIALLGHTTPARVAIFHAGLERSNAMPHDDLLGAPVPAQVSLSPHEVRVRIGDWESG